MFGLVDTECETIELGLWGYCGSGLTVRRLWRRLLSSVIRNLICHGEQVASSIFEHGSMCSCSGVLHFLLAPVRVIASTGRMAGVTHCAVILLTGIMSLWKLNAHYLLFLSTDIVCYQVIGKWY